MIKLLRYYFLICTLIFSLAGCNISSGVLEPTKISQPESPTVIFISPTSTTINLQNITRTPIPIPPTSTLKPSSTPTITPTPLNTLEPIKVEEVITALLQNPGDCSAPCFWGIVPGNTTYDEANQVFYQFGLSPYRSTVDGKDAISYVYHLNNDLRISIILGLNGTIVENIKFEMLPDAIDGKPESDWMAYSPSNIIKQYGTPSKVSIFWGLAERTTFGITMYYDDYDLTVEYHSFHGPEPSSPKLCPLKAEYDDISVWMGKNPPNPPQGGVQLYEATGLTIDEFVNLMTGYPKNSCFNLDINAFLTNP